MREMIFNDAAIQTPAASIHDVRPLLVDLAKGMNILVHAGGARNTLRMTRNWYEYQCAKNGTLFDVLRLIQSERLSHEREETRFLARLSQKLPLLHDLQDDIIERFRGCEPKLEAGAPGECLMLCAHLGAIAISLPIDSRFDRDRLVVRFQEIAPGPELNDVTLIELKEEIDNLARSVHANAILSRDSHQLFGNLKSPADIWTHRETMFPHLRFGLDMEVHLRQLDSRFMSVAFKRLSSLNQSAQEWPTHNGSMPKWQSNDITPESESTYKDNSLMRHRNFRDSNGQHAIFDWHAKGPIRIHFRFDPADFSIEIGYIGKHLPL